MKFLFFLLCILSVPFAAWAQDDARNIPKDRQQITLSYAPIVRQVIPSVANIYTKRTVQQRQVAHPFFSDPFFERFFGQNFGQDFGVRERTATSLGSGVIVDSSGLLVTNAHVVDGADEINVVLHDGQELQATQIFSDSRIDIAVLRLDNDGVKLPALDIPETTDLEVGDLVLAIGNPFGVGQTVTSGIVSALARTTVGVRDYSFFIQTDAAINPGNSGGALVAMNGDLVGINTAIYSRDGGSLGIGFAIPIELVRTVLNSVKRGEDKLVQPWLGVTGQTVTSDIARSMGLPTARGALITQVHPKSGPGRAGLRVGDVVTHINGKVISDPAALKFYLAMVEIGNEVQFDIIRKGEAQSVKFTAELPIEDPPRNETLIQGGHPLNGIRVANVNPAVLDELDMGGVEKGVVVTAIIERGRLALRTGDIIHSIFGQRINTVDDLKKALERPSQNWQMEIVRNGRTISVLLR